MVFAFKSLVDALGSRKSKIGGGITTACQKEAVLDDEAVKRLLARWNLSPLYEQVLDVLHAHFLALDNSQESLYYQRLIFRRKLHHTSGEIGPRISEFGYCYCKDPKETAIPHPVHEWSLKTVSYVDKRFLDVLIKRPRYFLFLECTRKNDLRLTRLPVAIMFSNMLPGKLLNHPTNSVDISLEKDRLDRYWSILMKPDLITWALYGCPKLLQLFVLLNRCLPPKVDDDAGPSCAHSNS